MKSSSVKELEKVESEAIKAFNDGKKIEICDSWGQVLEWDGAKRVESHNVKIDGEKVWEKETSLSDDELKAFRAMEDSLAEESYDVNYDIILNALSEVAKERNLEVCEVDLEREYDDEKKVYIRLPDDDNVRIMHGGETISLIKLCDDHSFAGGAGGFAKAIFSKLNRESVKEEIERDLACIQD